MDTTGKGVLIGASAGLGGSLAFAAFLYWLQVPIDLGFLALGVLAGVGGMAMLGAFAPRSAFLAGLLGGAWLAFELLAAALLLIIEVFVTALASALASCSF